MIVTNLVICKFEKLQKFIRKIILFFMWIDWTHNLVLSLSKYIFHCILTSFWGMHLVDLFTNIDWSKISYLWMWRWIIDEWLSNNLSYKSRLGLLISNFFSWYENQKDQMLVVFIYLFIQPKNRIFIWHFMKITNINMIFFWFLSLLSYRN